MLTDFLLNLLSTLLAWVGSAIHALEWTVTLPTSVLSFVSFALSYDDLLPIQECLACGYASFMFTSTIQGAKWLLQLVHWIADILP